MEITHAGISENILIPLWARAKETMYGNSILQDEKAIEIMKHIKYDFSKFDKLWITQIDLAVMTRILDDKAEKFINQYPDCIVINVGCGLDTRFERIDNGSVTWYDLDKPETIALRREFFKENERYNMISKSVLDESWINYIKEKDRKVLIIGEGIFIDFSETELESILKMLHKNFSQCECLFEIPPFLKKELESYGALKKSENCDQNNIQMKNTDFYGKYAEVIEEYTFSDFYNNNGNKKILNKIPYIKNNCKDKIVHIKVN